MAVALLGILLAACGDTSREKAAQVLENDRAAELTEKATEEGTEERASQASEPEVPAFTNYINQGDLAEIHQQGTLRLLAPKGLEEESLPRDGLPTAEWRALAEKFAEQRGLAVQWIYVDNFADLIPALREGRGDVIAVNFTRTEQRAEQVLYIRPLKYVQEQLITRRKQGSAPEQVTEAEPVKVAVRKGSAFEETISELAESSSNKLQVSLQAQILDEPISQDELLGGVADGTFAATIIDSNLSAVLLEDFPTLKAENLSDRRRAIAWAVRSNAVALGQALNEFLTEEHLVAAQQRNSARRDWAQIKESKTLRVLTRNHPASYFMWRGELMGFDYDLLKRFAKDHGLRLSMVVPGHDVDLAEALAEGMGDVIAASMTVTDPRKQQGLVFTRPYMQVTEQLIAAVDNTQELAVPVAERLIGQSVAVNPLNSYYSSLEALAALQSGVAEGEGSKPVNILPIQGATTEQLIDAVAEGRYDYTVADSHLVQIEQTYRDDFVVVGDLSEEQAIAWAVRDDQPELLGKLNDFLNKYYRGLFFNVTYNKYFKEEKFIKGKQGQRLRDTTELSPYDPLVRKHAVPADLDWRMVVSQMYQESRFNPKARSFAGARGLMQVMPRTGKQLGISDLYHPENSIRAGVSYLGWLEERFPSSLPFDQKIYFSLAAYNAGHGHVRDARVLAKKLGKDPNRWFDNVEEAMLLLSKPQYYKKARFGYVRGREPVNYVREIRDRYFGYLSVAKKERLGENLLEQLGELPGEKAAEQL
ncbi:transporter substrate-binding domain-containing protein [Microbulbifer agarilyticus]|uniref:transporter substrate-binding domain-containing protein n=1 Tax=Microbulbifer agarilyticus TaxID=260552 RepID=UPI001C93754C|nr:transporter substrate-binding domain-containing protein [Microbulbifer agarilyticus]MBY6190114.1 transporter substrate-binding domain-containing protein [Microbulbifer agarilyticus]